MHEQVKFQRMQERGVHRTRCARRLPLPGSSGSTAKPPPLAGPAAEFPVPAAVPTFMNESAVVFPGRSFPPVVAGILHGSDPTVMALMSYSKKLNSPY